MDIVILGNVCIDKNVSENASYTGAGGPAIFMYKILSKIPNVQTKIIAPYGKDFLAFSKNMPLYPKPTTLNTLVYENFSKNGKRQQKAYFRENGLPVKLNKEIKEIIQKADIIFVTPLLPNISPLYLKKALSYTQKSCLKVLLPQGYYRDFTKNDKVIVRAFTEEEKIIKLFDLLIVSKEDSEKMISKAKNWSKLYKIISVVTLGEDGAIAFKEGKEISLPTQPVLESNILDSVGAGDTFSACFTYVLKQTGNIEKSGLVANKIAGLHLVKKETNLSHLI